MKPFFGCVVIVAAAAWWGAQAQINQVRVTWKDNLALVDWTESLADPTAGPEEVPFTLLSGPYLSWLSPTSASIGWEVIAQKNLSATPFAKLDAKYPDGKIQFRSVTLNDLKPETTYRYRLAAAGPKYRYEGKEFSFRTFPKEGSEAFRFAIIGDTQRGDLKPEAAVLERKLFGLLQEWNPTLLVHMGDLLDVGKGDSVKGHQNWYRAFDRNRELRTGTFMAPTMGNHCWAGKGHGWFVDYFPHLKSINNDAQPPFYYSYDVANIHFIVLCSEAIKTKTDAKTKKKIDVSDEKLAALPFTYNDQIAWLKNDLAQTKATWKVVYFHKPMHTVGPYPIDEDIRKEFGSIFNKNDVQLILCGHDHSYQKTWRIDNVTREKSDTGSVQIVTGGGDTNLFNRSNFKAPWNIVHNKINHYVQVETTRDEMRFRAVDAKGDVFDTWRLRAKGQPEAMP